MLRSLAMFAFGLLWIVATTPRPTTATADVRLVPVIGMWHTSAEAGHPILTFDSALGTPAMGFADAQIAQLFGTHHETFARSTRIAGVFPLAVGHEVPNSVGDEIRVEFKLVGGATDQTAGIVFNLQPDGSYHFARYNTKDGNLAVWAFKDGVRTVLAHGEAHRQLGLGEWHELTLSVSGQTVRATSAAGALEVSHTLGAAVHGRVGVWTKNDSVTAFRRFDVEAEK